MWATVFFFSAWLRIAKAQDVSSYESYMRLSDNETFELDLNVANTKFRSLSVSQSGGYTVPYPANVTDATVNQNWNQSSRLVYSVSDNDCKLDTFFSSASAVFSQLSVINRDPYCRIADFQGQPDAQVKTQILFYQVLNRTLVFSEGKMYMSSAYFYNYGNGQYYNRYETLAITYNASTISQVELVGVANDTNFGNYQSNNTVTIFARYVPGFNETVTIQARFYFANISNNGAASPVTSEVKMWVKFYFVRPRLNKEFLLLEKTIDSSYSFRSDTVIAGIELTPDYVYELMFYIQNQKDMVVLNFNPLNIFGVQNIKFPFPIVQTNYATKTLWIVYTEFPDVGMATRRSYFIDRAAGSSIDLAALNIFSDSRYIRTVPNAESIDIIIESVKYSQDTAVSAASGGNMPVVIYSLHRYMPAENRMEVISSSVFFVPTGANMGSLIYRVESLSGLTDINIAMNSFFFDNNFVPPQVYRLSVPVSMDLYMGLGCKMYPANTTYNLYTDQMNQDPWTGHFFLFPFASTLTAGPEVNKYCRFFRQRSARGMLNIQNTQSPNTYFPYLNLLMQDFDNKATRVILKTQFFPLDTLKANGYPLWLGSNLTQLEVNSNFDRRNIDLDFLVRGSFIVRRLSDYPAVVDYLPMVLTDVDRLTRNSMYIVDNLRIPELNDLLLTEVDFIFALGKANTQTKEGTYLFIKRRELSIVSVYYCIGSNMVKQQDVPAFATPKRIFSLNLNQYLILSSDGALQSFSSDTGLFTPVYYPGVNCYDMQMFYSTRIKSALVCLNQNYQIVLYFVDELISRSVSNTLLSPVMPPDTTVPYLTAMSTLLTSGYHQNRIFVLTKNSTGRANLTILYLDLTDVPKLSIQRQFELVNTNVDNTGMPTKVLGIQFLKEKLLVFYRAMLNYNWMNVGEFTDTYDWIVTRDWRLSADLETDEDVTLTLFSRHLLSPIYTSDTKPYALLPVKIQGGSNVLVIDGLAPLLETMPTFLLPRHSQGPSMMLFPVYTARHEAYRYYSAGLFHWSKNPKGGYRDDSRSYYLFQFVRADKPRVYLSMTQQGLFGYHSLFLPFNSSQTPSISFSFESHLDLSANQVLTTQISLIQRRPIPAVSIGSTLFTDIKVGMMDSYVRSAGKAPLKLFTWRFSELYRGTVFDWVTEPDGFFDLVVDTFSFRKPFEVLKEFSLNGLQSLKNIDRFCYRFSLINGTLNCTRNGWVFFYDSEVEVFYQGDLKTLNPSSSVRFKFNPFECTDSLVNNHTLMTFCLRGQNKYVLQTSLIDQLQTTIVLDMLNLDPLLTEAKIPPRPVGQIYSDYIFEYAKLLTDSMNINRTSKLYYFYSTLSFNQSLQQTCSSPFNYTTTFVKSFDSSANTEGSGVSFQPSETIEKNYRFSSILLNTGNLVSAQVVESPYTEGYLRTLTSDKYYFNDGKAAGITQFVFGFNSTKDVKLITLNSPHVDEIIFNDTDPVLLAPYDFQRFTMITLPSYHSYLIRHSGAFHLYNLSIYKLENPFAEIQNLYWSNKPICMRWACILVTQFADKQFLMVYDLNPENALARKQPPNFLGIFGSTIQPDGTRPSFFDFDMVPANYTFYPIQILNLTNLRLVKLEPTLEASPLNLTVLLYFSTGKVQVYRLNRNTELTASNLYFGSEFVEFKAQTNFGVQKAFHITLNKWTEGDYVKYYTVLAAGVFISLLTCILSVRVLRAQPSASEVTPQLAEEPSQESLINRKTEKILNASVSDEKPILRESVESLIPRDSEERLIPRGSGEVCSSDISRPSETTLQL